MIFDPEMAQVVLVRKEIFFSRTFDRRIWTFTSSLLLIKKWKSVSKAGQAVEASWYFEIWLFGSPNFDFTEVLRFLYLLKISGTSKSVFPFWKATVKQYLFTLRLKSSSFCSNNRNFEDGNKCWHNWHRCWRIVTCQNEALSL